MSKALTPLTMTQQHITPAPPPIFHHQHECTANFNYTHFTYLSSLLQKNNLEHYKPMHLVLVFVFFFGGGGMIP